MAFTAQAVLKRNQLFRHLDEAALAQVATLATRRTASKGTLIFAQGDQGDALFGVAAGQVRISATDSTGQERHIRDFGPGHTFGEIAILDGGTRTASALAVTDTELLVISRARFVELLERDSSLAVHLLKVLCERLRYTSELVEDSAFLNLPGQLAKKLLQLAEQNGIRSTDSIEVIISQSELGEFLGVTRQIINAHLQTWREKGWVRLGRGRVFIVAREQLGKISEGDLE